ncbi:MAG: 6-oxocyclohex-1-ene-1-carbonyl-CoA hydratase [Sterolibacterium sp.]|jgi:6-oxo-cyclohex-1-ene-carbonyl-CoA hydrolase|nr:6-oxocyclohex-1-ene-1-carbonyl-CoA hydratase [Sterolibacterium sp.]
MSLDWLPRDNVLKNHALFGDEHVSHAAPGVIFEKRPLLDAAGQAVDGLYSAWVWLNNPAQHNAYTTEMVKGVIAGFQRASSDRSVVAVVFAAVGDKAWSSGGNTAEYAAYYSRRPHEYGDYIDLFNRMVDGVLECRKPVICRATGMRVAGGQEIGLAADLTVSSDLAMYGQAGPRHGSSPVGGSTDFLPWFLSIEDAIYNCVSCELWSAYKMKHKGMISKVLPVLKNGDEWLRNPLVRTDTWLEEGEIVYGELIAAEQQAAARALIAACTVDFSRIDAEIHKMIWNFANLFPNCLQTSLDSLRAKKKFFWDAAKHMNRHWLQANMNNEAWLGFNAYNTKKLTGRDTIDFIRLRQRLAQGAALDEQLMEEVLAQPQPQP